MVVEKRESMKCAQWFWGVALLFLSSSPLLAAPALTLQALSERLLGFSLPEEHPLHKPVSELIQKGQLEEAAKRLIEDARFLDIKVRDFAAQYTNIDENPNVEFDDFQALFIGIAKDGRDARELLTADYRYEVPSRAGMPQATLKNNDHYLAIQRQEKSISANLVQVAPQWPGLNDAAGALTTFSFARAHYVAGTNRRAFKYAMQEFLCRTPEQWRQLNLKDDRVRGDVDRFPSGIAMTYQQECRGCHSGMDGMAGAFAFFDFTKDGFTVNGPRRGVAKKYNANNHVSPFGFVTRNASWVNYLTESHNSEIGWDPEIPLSGSGVASLGKMLAHTKAFDECLAERVYRHVCRQKKVEKAITHQIADKFRQKGRPIVTLFVEAAIHPACHTNLNSGGAQ